MVISMTSSRHELALATRAVAAAAQHARRRLAVPIVCEREANAHQSLLLGPPPGSPRGTCGALPVIVFKEGESITGYASFWRPSPKELAKLNAGAHVRLDIFGGGHPPVWLDVETVEELP